MPFLYVQWTDNGSTTATRSLGSVSSHALSPNLWYCFGRAWRRKGSPNILVPCHYYPQNLPHNPLINSGAIMACSLVRPSLPIAERFEAVVETLDKLSGGNKWGFSNSVYLSEKETADSNFCLAYMVMLN
jgi:Glutaminase